MSEIKRLSREFSYASIGNIIVQLGGLITFPIWTRLFSVKEYGLLSIILLTISIIGSLSKFGLQHAATRYYSIYCCDSIKEKKLTYFTTILISGIAFSIFFPVVISFLLYSIQLPALKDVDSVYYVIIGILAYTASSKQLFDCIYYVEQKAMKLAILNILNRYGQFILSIMFVLYFSIRLKGFFYGQIIIEVIVVALITFPYIVSNKIKIKHYSFEFLNEALKYGVPMLAFEISKTLLTFGDRYIIEYYMGAKHVGIYAAGYNLCTYALCIISVTLQNVLMPIYLKIYDNDGKQKTEKFLSQVIKYYIMINIPIAIIFLFFGEDIIRIVASEKYVPAYQIFPYIIPSLVINGAYFIFGAGLYIKNKSLTIFSIISVAMTVNVALNILLIEPYGIKGAAVATLIAYVIFVISVYFMSKSIVRVRVKGNDALKLILYALELVAIILLGNMLGIHFIVISIIGAGLYTLTLVYTDMDLNNILAKRYSFIQAR